MFLTKKTTLEIIKKMALAAKKMALAATITLDLKKTTTTKNIISEELPHNSYSVTLNSAAKKSCVKAVYLVVIPCAIL